MTDVAITNELGARRIAIGTAKATRWPTETWVIYEAGAPGRSVQQVELYRHGGTWYAWTGSASDRAAIVQLAAARNAS